MASPHWKRILSEKLRALSYSNTPDALPQELARALFQPGGRYVSSMTRLETWPTAPTSISSSTAWHWEPVMKERSKAWTSATTFTQAFAGFLGRTLTRQKRQWRDASDEDIREISSTIAGVLYKR